MLRKSTDDLVIKPRLSSSARLALVMAAILAVAGASLAGYWGGRAVLHQRLETRAQEIESLKAALRDTQARYRSQTGGAEAARERLAAGHQAAREELESELDAARRRLKDTRRQLEDARSSLARVTRQLQIDQTAYAALREELEASNRQITELAGELAFYRSIISPADGRSGVRIQEFDLQPTDKPREYRYRLILIQALDHEEPVQGSVRFEINGTGADGNRTIRAPSRTQDPITAAFRYFQNLVGTFSVPEGFMPAEVRVIFQADDAEVQRTYPWPARAPAAGAT